MTEGSQAPAGPPEAGAAAERPFPPRLLAVAGLATLAIFLLDVWLPLGAAAPSLYLAVVLLGLWSPRRRFGLVAALACGALTIAAPFLSRGGRPPGWIETLNRPLMLVPLLLGALLLARHKTISRRLALEQARAAEERRAVEEERRRAEAVRWREASLARIGEMAAIVAHEVRNPLAGIKGVLQVVGRRLPEGGGDRAAVLEAVRRLDGLDALTEELLMFARPRAAEKVPLDLGALVSECVSLLLAERAADGLLVEVSGSAGTLHGDPAQLRAIVTNLLRNGAEATAGRGRLEVTLDDHPDGVELSVRDDGPGVPAGQRELVFEPFYTTRTRGTGLGLAIVWRAVEAHGGSISVEDAPGGGALFRVRLPRSQPSADDRRMG